MALCCAEFSGDSFLGEGGSYSHVCLADVCRSSQSAFPHGGPGPATAGLAQPSGPCSAAWYCSGGANTSRPVNGTGMGGLCPAGAYCPAGTAAPLPCPARVSVCHGQSARPDPTAHFSKLNGPNLTCPTNSLSFLHTGEELQLEFTDSFAITNATPKSTNRSSANKKRAYKFAAAVFPDVFGTIDFSSVSTHCHQRGLSSLVTRRDPVGGWMVCPIKLIY